MSDLNNMSNTKEISFVDLILNFWKFKIKFFIILVTLLFLSILLEKFIPKKDSIEIKLTNPVIVNLRILSYQCNTYFRIRFNFY